MLKNLVLLFQVCVFTAVYAADMGAEKEFFPPIENTSSNKQVVAIDELPITTMEEIISGACRTKSLIMPESVSQLVDEQLSQSTTPCTDKFAKRFTATFNTKHIVFITTNSTLPVIKDYVKFVYDPSALDWGHGGMYIPITCIKSDGSKNTFRIKSEAILPLTSQKTHILTKVATQNSTPSLIVPLKIITSPKSEVKETEEATSSPTRTRGKTLGQKFKDSFTKKKVSPPSSPTTRSPENQRPPENPVPSIQEVTKEQPRVRSKTVINSPVSDKLVSELKQRFKEHSVADNK